jgi:membrane fusion protein, peptide pheromone/bacteriocin exporter
MHSIKRDFEGSLFLFFIMDEINKLADMKDSAHFWIPSLRRSGFIIYWLVIGMFLAGFLALFFIRVDISVRATGIIRPYNERTDIHSPASGIIEQICFKDGDLVLKNNILAIIRDSALVKNQLTNDLEILQYQALIHDLKLLTTDSCNPAAMIPGLHSPLYKQQALRFSSGLSEQQILLSKASRETILNEKLARDKVISQKEIFDIRMQEQKIISANETYRRNQYSEWQADLIKYNTELEQHLFKQEELSQMADQNRIRAPVTGHLQESVRYYPGSTVLSGELICTISPVGFLMGECFVTSKDIGMLKTGQKVRFQIEAFDYNYFGMATGQVFSIADDIILIDKTPVFKVMCRLNETSLKLSNGYTGEIKKGMGFRARFITTKRTLWQLLYDNLKNWFDPTQGPV